MTAPAVIPCVDALGIYRGPARNRIPDRDQLTADRLQEEKLARRPRRRKREQCPLCGGTERIGSHGGDTCRDCGASSPVLRRYEP